MKETIVGQKIKERIDPSWYYTMYPVLNNNAMFEIAKRVSDFRNKNVVYPEKEEMFRAFKLPMHEIKVVIVGQDPYHNGNADGLAFSCKEKISPSLRRIYKACNYEGDIINLERWEKQGVFLLNTILTVNKGQANSHSNIGWQYFTSNAILRLQGLYEHIVFLLWGEESKSFFKHLIYKPNHCIVESEHPVAGMYKGNDWEHNDCFEKANEYLIEHKKEPILWKN